MNLKCDVDGGLNTVINLKYSLSFSLVKAMTFALEIYSAASYFSFPSVNMSIEHVVYSVEICIETESAK